MHTDPNRPLKRTGLHRLMCAQDCGAPSVYMTFAGIERGPLPGCGCGAALLPEHPELAALVLPPEQWQSHPWLAEFARQAQRVQHGQAAHLQRGRTVRSDLEIAGQRVSAAMREDARRRQLAGLQQSKSSAAAAADIPF